MNEHVLKMVEMPYLGNLGRIYYQESRIHLNRHATTLVSVSASQLHPFCDEIIISKKTPTGLGNAKGHRSLDPKLDGPHQGHLQMTPVLFHCGLEKKYGSVLHNRPNQG